jgi:hypothetical protein
MIDVPGTAPDAPAGADPSPSGEGSPDAAVVVTPAAEPQSPNVYQMLAARARRATDGHLVLDASVGVVALASLPFVRPLLWGLVLPFAIVGAYGVWGIADRELSADDDARGAGAPPSAAKRRLLIVTRRLSVVLGTAAAVIGGALFMVLVLGQFIS